MPTYGSLFSGVGGFDMGFDQAGYDCVFQVEWDKHCQQILAKHWPEVPKWSDVQEVNGAELPPCDVLTFGSPCQDLSVAGKRAGLDGNRSVMFYEATRIIKEMRDATQFVYPRIVVWENVSGAITSNKGADFGQVLDTLADIGAVDIHWSILDAQYFGVPQRRRRIFVVAIFDPSAATRCPDTLLPVTKSSRGDFIKSKKAQQNITENVERSFDPSDEEPRLTPVAYSIREDAKANTFSANETDTALCLNGLVPSTQSHHAQIFIAEPYEQNLRVRRFTPLECERLQGWPDEHTRWTDDGSEQSYTTRFKQCGNGVATPVAKWVAKHIKGIL